jgi:hypothetical protein
MSFSHNITDLLDVTRHVQILPKQPLTSVHRIQTSELEILTYVKTYEILTYIKIYKILFQIYPLKFGIRMFSGTNMRYNFQMESIINCTRHLFQRSTLKMALQLGRNMQQKTGATKRYSKNHVTSVSLVAAG